MRTRILLCWCLSLFLMSGTLAHAGSDTCCMGAPLPKVVYAPPVAPVAAPFVIPSPVVYLRRAVKPYCVVSQVSFPPPSCSPIGDPWPHNYPYVISYGAEARHR
jgi:hypothetical protein